MVKDLGPSEDASISNVLIQRTHQNHVQHYDTELLADLADRPPW